MSPRQALAQGPQDGRAAQRGRTRRAIVEAAGRLLSDGGTPTVDQVAEAAEVSRRNVYLHFPTFDQLLLDASLGVLSAAQGGPEAVVAGWGAQDDASGRVQALTRAVLGLGPQALALGRQVIRLTVDAPQPDERTPRRGHRRTHWIDAAVEPLREVLDDEQLDRLVSALTVVIGFEGMVIMRDVRGADAATEERVLTWAATALVEAMRAEAERAEVGSAGPGSARGA